MTRAGTGLPPNIAATLAYAFGAVSGIVFLMIERNDQFVRFHAWQSTITFLGALLASLLVASFPVIGGLLNVALTAGVVAVWVLLMVKAFSGEKFKLPYVGEIAEQQIR
jgi:uncharacterized membrane protein